MQALRLARRGATRTPDCYCTEIVHVTDSAAVSLIKTINRVLEGLCVGIFEYFQGTEYPGDSKTNGSVKFILSSGPRPPPPEIGRILGSNTWSNEEISASRRWDVPFEHWK